MPNSNRPSSKPKPPREIPSCNRKITCYHAEGMANRLWIIEGKMVSPEDLHHKLQSYSVWNAPINANRQSTHPAASPTMVSRKLSFHDQPRLQGSKAHDWGFTITVGPWFSLSLHSAKVRGLGLGSHRQRVSEANSLVAPGTEPPEFTSCSDLCTDCMLMCSCPPGIT